MSESTDVVRVEPDEYSVSEITAPTTGAIQRLEAEVRALDKAFRWAKSMSRTTMVPEHFQQATVDRRTGEPLGEVAAYNLAAAVMYGLEIGLSAMASAQNIFVVHGKPAVYARTMAAQVRAAGYVIEEVEASDKKVVWKALRDDVWAFSEWTIERATVAGYTSNAKYRSNPQEMLRAKCIAEVCRIKFQDVLLGMAYSIEELQLEQATVQRVVKNANTKASLRELAEAETQREQTMSDAPAQPEQPQTNGTIVVDPECLVEEPAAQEEQEEATEETGAATSGQLTEIRKLYKARGLTGMAMLDDINLFLQRDEALKTLHDITDIEAFAILAYLQPAENG
jgi:hypothetical protein